MNHTNFKFGSSVHQPCPNLMIRPASKRGGEIEGSAAFHFYLFLFLIPNHA